jgi:hypothetical protein
LSAAITVFQSFAAGDVSLAACARAVDLMMSICGTLAKLVSLRSAYVPAMAKVALLGCRDCEAECRKHDEKHAACKACAETCAACAAQEDRRLIHLHQFDRLFACHRRARPDGAARAVLQNRCIDKDKCKAGF